MMREGTVVNGVIVLDGPPPFPDGMRVRYWLVDGEDDATASTPYICHATQDRPASGDSNPGSD